MGSILIDATPESASVARALVHYHLVDLSLGLWRCMLGVEADHTSN